MQVSRCPTCDQRMIPTQSKDGRTDLTCMWCEKPDPMSTELAKWADSPLAEPAIYEHLERTRLQ